MMKGSVRLAEAPAAGSRSSGTKWCIQYTMIVSGQEERYKKNLLTVYLSSWSGCTTSVTDNADNADNAASFRQDRRSPSRWPHTRPPPRSWLFCQTFNNPPKHRPKHQHASLFAAATFLSYNVLSPISLPLPSSVCVAASVCVWVCVSLLLLKKITKNKK